MRLQLIAKADVDAEVLQRGRRERGLGEQGVGQAADVGAQVILVIGIVQQIGERLVGTTERGRILVLRELKNVQWSI